MCCRENILWMVYNNKYKIIIIANINAVRSNISIYLTHHFDNCGGVGRSLYTTSSPKSLAKSRSKSK
jgi:hypothetical protein